MKFLGFVLHNAWRSKLRTLLTVVSTGVALFLFCMLRTVITSLDASVDVADVSRLVVRRSTSLIFPLPLSYRDRLAQVDGVTGVSWANWFGGINPAREREFFSQFGVDADTYFELYPEFELKPEELAAFKSERTACIIGERLAKRFGWKPGDDITVRGTIYPGDWRFTVRGVFHPRSPDLDSNILYFQWKYLDESIGRRSEVGIYIVKLADPGQAASTGQAIDKLFANSSAETHTETEKAFQLGFVTMMGNIRFAVRIVSIFVLAGFLLVAVNTMLMAARERTREIAVLKTLGFPDALVLRLVLAESCLISFVGGASGCVWALVIFTLLKFSGMGMFTNFAVKPATLLWGLAISLGMGAVSGLLPALAASRLRVVDALRQA
jgi:putative ABC transport system permease protein